MENFDLFPSLNIGAIKSEEEVLRISLQSNTSSAHCPYCKERSNRKNGHYTRYPYDLPLAEKQVRLELRVQRYFCLNEIWTYKKFGEQLPLVGRYAQRCQRLLKAHSKIAIQLGGEAGSELID